MKILNRTVSDKHGTHRESFAKSHGKVRILRRWQDGEVEYT